MDDGKFCERCGRKHPRHNLIWVYSYSTNKYFLECLDCYRAAGNRGFNDKFRKIEKTENKN